MDRRLREAPALKSTRGENERGRDIHSAAFDFLNCYSTVHGRKEASKTTYPQLIKYNIPTSASEPGGIVAGPDGALWFVETAVNKIGRISTDGVVTEYPVPTAGAIETDQGFLAVGPDGALWFTGYGSTEIGRMTTDGTLTKFQVPTTAGVPYHITSGPDDNLWFTEQQGNKIGQIKFSAP